MPYCPQCRSEYRAGVNVCPECDVPLVESLGGQDDPYEETRDVYVSFDQQQAERLRELLEEEGLEVLVRDRSSHVFPTNVGMTAQLVIAVPAHEVARARGVIESAVQDGVVAGDGELL